MVREVRFASEDAGGFDPPDLIDAIDEWDEDLLEVLLRARGCRPAAFRQHRRRPFSTVGARALPASAVPNSPPDLPPA